MDDQTNRLFEIPKMFLNMLRKTDSAKTESNASRKDNVNIPLLSSFGREIVVFEIITPSIFADKAT
jgi:hypothetical protein